MERGIYRRPAPEPDWSLRIAVENAGFGDAGQAVLDRAGARFADAFDAHEIGDAGTHDLRQAAEALDHVLGDRVGQPRDPVEEPVAAWLHGRVEVHLGRQAE